MSRINESSQNSPTIRTSSLSPTKSNLDLPLSELDVNQNENLHSTNSIPLKQKRKNANG